MYKNIDVYTESQVLKKVISFEAKGESRFASLPKGMIVDKVRVVVNEAFDDGATLTIKANGETGKYGTATTLSANAVKNTEGKDPLGDDQDITLDISGNPTMGGVTVLFFVQTPTKRSGGY